MYEHMTAAEIPPELSREEVAVYFEELQRHVHPLLEQAIDIYQRNLRLGERLGRHDQWVERTEAGLNRLKEVLRRQAEQDAERSLKSP